MDFGDILNQWEEQEKKSAVEKKKQSQRPAGSGKKLNAPSLFPDEKPKTAENKGSSRTAQATKAAVHKQEPKINPMNYWMNRYGVVDKDAQRQKEEEREAMIDFSQLRFMPTEATLDLHGLTRDEAWTQLDLFISECKRRKLRKVLIVHGKGNHSPDAPVLSAVVRNFIERDYRLGASGHPDKNEGGRGATWVVLKESSTKD